MLALMIKPVRRLLLALLCALPVASWAADDVLSAAIKKINGNVVFMRHAIAPGNGDPDNFKIGDCSTQRNLDDTGRSQARAIGKALSQSRTQFAEILSSEWCRCQETTTLLGLGKWATFEGLNSFFQGYADADTTIPKLQKKAGDIKTWRDLDGVAPSRHQPDHGRVAQQRRTRRLQHPNQTSDPRHTQLTG